VEDNLLPVDVQFEKVRVENPEESRQTSLSEMRLQKRSHQVLKPLQAFLKSLNRVLSAVAALPDLLGIFGVHRLEISENLCPLVFELIDSGGDLFRLEVGKLIDQISEFFFLSIQPTEIAVHLVPFFYERLLLLLDRLKSRFRLSNLALKLLLRSPKRCALLTAGSKELDPLFARPATKLGLPVCVTQCVLNIRLVTL
jgi:hypothetical protein